MPGAWLRSKADRGEGGRVCWWSWVWWSSGTGRCWKSWKRASGHGGSPPSWCGAADGAGWLARYAQGGLGGLADRSSRPVSCPHQMPAPVEARIVGMRRDHPGWGPSRIRAGAGAGGRGAAAGAVGGVPETRAMYSITADRADHHGLAVRVWGRLAAGLDRADLIEPRARPIERAEIGPAWAAASTQHSAIMFAMHRQHSGRVSPGRALSRSEAAVCKV